MGLSSVLNIANSGLSVTQSGLDVVARNIANAGTEGYTSKRLEQEAIYSLDGGRGARAVDVSRDVNEFLAEQVRVQSSRLAGLEVKRDFLARVDQLFGEPGGQSGLDTIINSFGQSIQDLISSPDAYTTRESVVGDAQLVAQQIRTLSDDIQSLRQLAEDRIGDTVNDINDTLQQLQKLNSELTSFGGSTPPADTLDQRDKFINRLSSIMEISVVENANNSVTIRTAGGATLLENSGVTLAFDNQGQIGPEQLYSSDSSERGVGTVTLTTTSGFSLDLIANGVLGTGQLGTLIELRDDTLVQAQSQLDELAHGLALAFSNKTVEGTEATNGAQNGLEIDLADLQSGNSISLSYTQNGTERNITFVRVDDASKLPLDNTATADPNDIVYGINFSAGYANAISDIDSILTTTLGASLTVSNPSGNVLQILDDGAGATSDVNSLSADVTSTSTQDDGLSIPFFVDSGGTGDKAYTASLEGISQKLGFASRIEVNAAIVANNELLVRHSTTPETPLGDQSRPLELYARIAETNFTFSSSTGIGQGSNPYSGSVLSFSQRVISYQSGQASYADRVYQTQDVVTSSLQDRFTADVSVNVDEELSNLITLQNTFSANARVIQTTSELMDILLRL